MTGLHKGWRLAALLIVIGAGAGGVIWQQVGGVAGLISSRQQQNDALIAEKLARSVGVLAYLYGYPLVDMARQQHNDTHITSAEQKVYAPLNRFYLYPEIVGPDNDGDLRAPNNDTLYFSAWYDVSREPLILHTPDTNGRYYTVAVTNRYAEVEHIGRSTTGTEEGYFALVSPDWQGELPAGVRRVVSETPSGWLLGRLLVEGEADFDAAMGLLQQFWLSELSQFHRGQPAATPPPQHAPAMANEDSLEFFAIMNRELKRLPPRVGERALLAQFDQIGVGPNSDFSEDKLSAAQRRGLLSALEDGRAIVEASTQRTIPDYNGWMISSEIGRYGANYMQRAAVVRGGYGNLPEESLYPARVFDDNGQLLNGGNRYRLHFTADQMSPVDGFWSLSLYRLSDLQLEENAIARYSIGDRTPGLHYGDDGSLTLLLQHDAPSGDSNWLPAPAGPFLAVMRLYEPRQEVLENDYLLPIIERLD